MTDASRAPLSDAIQPAAPRRRRASPAVHSSFRASLSAINLENQGFTQNVHENVHETSEF